MTVTLNPFDRDQATLVPIGSAYSVTLGKMLDAGKAVDDSHTVLPYIRAANIQDDGLRLDDVNEMPFSSDEAARLNLRRGDLLVVEGGAVGTSVVLEHDMAGWSFQKTVNRVRPTGDWSTRYLGYVLRAYRDAGVIDLVCNGSTIPHLTAEKLRALRIPTASPDAQRAIADYLDRETRRIDTLIEEQQCLIDMLHERREALIERSLLESCDAPIRLSRIASSRSGDVPPPLEEDGKYIVWGAGRVVGHTSHVNAQAGDLLVGRVGQGSVGKVRRLTEAAWATDNTIVLRLDSSVADPRYVEHGLRLIPRFELVGGGAMPLVTAERLLAQPVPFTDLVTQRRVADYLDQQTAKIDLLVEETDRFIELSRERRSALITAAVTGQIDVREMV